MANFEVEQQDILLLSFDGRFNVQVAYWHGQANARAMPAPTVTFVVRILGASVEHKHRER